MSTSKFALALGAALGLVQVWTAIELSRTKDQLATVTKLLEDAYLKETIEACRRNRDERPFPIQTAKRSWIKLESITE